MSLLAWTTLVDKTQIGLLSYVPCNPMKPRIINSTTIAVSGSFIASLETCFVPSFEDFVGSCLGSLMVNLVEYSECIFMQFSQIVL